MSSRQDEKAHRQEIERHKRFLAENPDKVHAMLKIGDLSLKIGDTRAAIDWYWKALEQFEHANEWMKGYAVVKQVRSLLEGLDSAPAAEIERAKVREQLFHSLAVKSKSQDP